MLGEPTQFDIQKLASAGLCTGCGLCAAVSGGSVKMRLNASGYLRPVADHPGALPPDRQAELNQVCPAVSLRLEAPELAQMSTLWGPIVHARTGHAVDAELRHTGSSGGAISALCWYLLSTGKVDAVAQVATSGKDPLQNVLQVSRTRADVLAAAGSRYAPAAPLEPLLEALKHGTRLAFVGKPCDVAALRQYLRLRPELAPQLPILISFMCAGVPSINGTHEVLQAMGADRSRLASFRYRGDGWPGMAKAVLIDGQSFEMDYNTSWGTILGRHLQFRCKICPDGTGEFADVVCADAWYGTDGYPDFTEQAGRSVVLSRTQQGEALIKAAMQDGFLKTATLQLSELQAMQPYQVTRKRMVLGRTLAARLAIGSAPKYRGLRLLRAALGGSLLAMLKQSWGTYKRAAPERQ